MFGGYLYSDLRLQAVKGISVIRTGFLLLPYLVPNAISSIATGIALSRSRYANPYMLVASALIFGGNYFLSRADENSLLWKVILVEIVIGLGGGMGQLLAIGFAQKHVAKELQPLTLSMAMMMQLLGGALAITIGGTVFNTQLDAKLKDNSLLTDGVKALVATAISDPQSLKTVLSHDDFQILIGLYAQSTKTIFLASMVFGSVALVVAIHQKWSPRTR